MRTSARFSESANASLTAGWWGVPTLVGGWRFACVDLTGLPWRALPDYCKRWTQQWHSAVLESVFALISKSCTAQKRNGCIWVDASRSCPWWIMLWSRVPLRCYGTGLACAVTASEGPRQHKLLQLGLLLRCYVLVLLRWPRSYHWQTLPLRPLRTLSPWVG